MSRKALDFYETPEWVTRLILPEIEPAGLVLEPACGNGAISRLVHRCGRVSQVHGIELCCERATKTGAVWGNFLELPIRDRYDLVITNPPYRDAEAFVIKSMKCIKPYGKVVMLLRLGFMASQGRELFWNMYPADVFILPKRPCFRPEGGTDNTDYAWYVWGEGRGNRWKRLSMKNL